MSKDTNEERRNATPEEIAKAQEILEYFNEEKTITLPRGDWIRLELAIVMAKREGRRFLDTPHEADVLGLGRDKSVSALHECGRIMRQLEEMILSMEMPPEMTEAAAKINAETNICFCGDCEIVVEDDGTVRSKPKQVGGLEGLLSELGIPLDAVVVVGEDGPPTA